jgi:hypothetical protein
MWTWTKKIAPMIDLAVAPLLIPSAVILKSVRRYGIDRLPGSFPFWIIIMSRSGTERGSTVRYGTIESCPGWI